MVDVHITPPLPARPGTPREEMSPSIAYSDGQCVHWLDSARCIVQVRTSGVRTDIWEAVDGHAIVGFYSRTISCIYLILPDIDSAAVYSSIRLLCGRRSLNISHRQARLRPRLWLSRILVHHGLQPFAAALS